MTGRILQNLVALLLSLLWATTLGIWHQNGDVSLVDRAEGALTDLRLLARGIRKPPDLVTIVAIDDETVQQSGGYPLPRSDLATIIEAVARFEPRVIAVDLLLLDPGKGDGDVALTQALERRPATIAAAAIFPEATQLTDSAENDPLARLPRAEKFLRPLPAFAEHAAIGVVNLAMDKSGAPRSVPMLFRSSDSIELSFPLRVSALASGSEPVVEANGVRLSDRLIPTDIGHVLPLAFYGPQGTIRTISAAKLLSGEIDRSSLRDRIVVIGTTVTGAGDVFSTPFDRVMPGVEIIATAIDHLMTGDGLVRDRSTRAADALIAAALTGLLVGLLAWRRSAVGFLSIAVVLVAWVIGSELAFSHGLWLSAALPVAAAGPPLILFGAAQLWLNRRQAQHFAVRSELLQQFQAPALRKWLTKDPNFLVQPLHLEAAVIFIDLSGFTSLSETLGLDAGLALLKDFHTLIDRKVVARSGIITSFLGDGAMILFGLPESGEEDARNAALCCLDLCSQTEQWIKSLPSSIALQTGFKVGAHFGPVVASRLGDSYQHITATGDTVNVASRLMEVAAQQGAMLAVSDDLLRRAGPKCALFEFGSIAGPAETRIRGRSGALRVWLWTNAPAPSAKAP